MHPVLKPLVLALLAALVAAASYTSGVGRLNSGGPQHVSFNLDSYQDAIDTIFESLAEGPNRTLSASVPVDKVYGVNVRHGSHHGDVFYH